MFSSILQRQDQAVPVYEPGENIDRMYMYTNLFDDEDPQLQTEFTLQQYQLLQSPVMDTVLSPPHPSWLPLEFESLVFFDSDLVPNPTSMANAFFDSDLDEDLMDLPGAPIEKVLADSAIPDGLLKGIQTQEHHHVLDQVMEKLHSSAALPASAPVRAQATRRPGLKSPLSTVVDIPYHSTQTRPQVSNSNGIKRIRKNDDSSQCVPTLTIFRCELCPFESFGRVHDVKRHQISRHNGIKKWSCEFCPLQFARRDAILRHYTIKSGREDGIHPMSHEVERLHAAKARARLIF